ncbi:MAG: hypothetical protein R3B95_21450 [Nitrospirales bacterium]|nr:hypothetical protein [Nitrospirales bacterium]
MEVLLLGCSGKSFLLSEEGSSPGECIVFGSITLQGKGEEDVNEKYPKGGGVSLYHESGGSPLITIGLKEGHTRMFFLSLKPGRYFLPSFKTGFDLGDIKSIKTYRVFSEFRAQDPKSIAYIGDLSICFEGCSSFASVRDQYEMAVQIFKEKFPKINSSIFKSLMQREKAL